MSRLLLFVKGLCIGFTDVVPGVSGGTLALILGVYQELVDTIRGLNLRFVPLAFRYLKTRDDASKRALIESLTAMNVLFLFTLVSGIGFAIAIGSMVIPTLMENYPVQMRAFFCGLIIASATVPYRMLGKNADKRIVAGTIALGVVLGYLATDPRNTFELSREWHEVVSEGESLKEIMRRGPSATGGAEVFWAAENEALRQAVAQATPEKFAELERIHRGEHHLLATDKDGAKSRSAPYEEVAVPDGTVVKVPRPTMWFVFLSGAIAICAMILPGISGSYVLLIFGNYFFVLNAVKGTLTTLATGTIPWTPLLFVILFCVGCAVGIRLFSHVLSYLLRERAVPTLGLLIGLMVGCLRGIWPFQVVIEGAVTNVAPTAQDPLGVAVAMFVIGIIIVLVFSRLGRRKLEGDA